MQLSVDDMRRIVSGGDLFVLVDIRPVEITKGRSIPGALRVPLALEIVPKVLTASGQSELPIVICGDGATDPVAEEAAELLRKAGFSEVWTYSSDPEAWVRRDRRPPAQAAYVTSDPDACLNC